MCIRDSVFKRLQEVRSVLYGGVYREVSAEQADTFHRSHGDYGEGIVFLIKEVSLGFPLSEKLTEATHAAISYIRHRSGARGRLCDVAAEAGSLDRV